MATRKSASPPRDAKPAAATPLVFVRNETARAGVPLTATFTRWIEAALRGAGRRKRAEVNILVTDGERGRAYNRQFRQRDYATNVLSFPYEPMPHEKTALIGDLVICAPVVAMEAIAQGKRSRDHWAHMTVHGVLHLVGHDHIDDADAERMEALERRILAGLGIADPYAGER
ncbi:rRNA maturation RNase YbeY [Dokdonella sp. MW10]|uniref:rRNA maturation RNase YbeY n=1 Tax=Dokdonella sp. MW10 TaxID=2992926 RepID=UPI003F7F37B9